MRTRTEFPIGAHLIRYADLVSMHRAGHSETAAAPAAQRFALIASDASEPVAADASIAMPHGFNLQAERRVERGGSGGHGSRSAEVLIVHTGRWRLTLGPGEEAKMDLVPGDVASIPPNLFRQWERLDGEVGFLFIAEGLQAGTDPDGRAAVLESVGDQRRWVQDGRFIDDSSGIPRMREVVGGKEHLALPGDSLAHYTIHAPSIAPCARSALTLRGVAEAGIISPAVTQDGFAQGAIRAQWPHGFSLRWLTLQSGAYAPPHTRAESEVILLQAGMLEVSLAGGPIMLGAGDVLSVPVGVPRALRNTTSRPTQAFIVRGSEDPAMPQFDSLPTLEILKSPFPAAST